MQLSDYDYELPPELIAAYPLAQRSASRLLKVPSADGAFEHLTMRDFTQCCRPGDCLVFNNTKVMPARMFGEKSTGGKVEILIERVLAPARALAMLKANRRLKLGQLISVAGYSLEVVACNEGHYTLQSNTPIEQLMAEQGHMPLPHYMQRADEVMDEERYQTVYAQHSGAVAAPTAGLHFDEVLLNALAAQGVQSAFVTLHVGAGTFTPVREADIRQHRMHSEWMVLSEQTVDKLKATRAAGGRIIAVGTTALRCLESAARGAELQAFRGETDIYIYPGFEFRCVDAMLTNFHLPRSSLLILLAAFIGRERILVAYQEAIAQRYRFYSYGDAMFVQRPIS